MDEKVKDLNPISEIEISQLVDIILNFLIDPIRYDIQESISEYAQLCER